MAQRLLPRPLSRFRDLPVVGQTTPARLLRLGAVLVLGCLLTAVVSLASGLHRQAAAERAGGRASELAVDVSAIYRSLADADAMATSGYVAGGRLAGDPVPAQTRYQADLAAAIDRLTDAAARLPLDDPSRGLVAGVLRELPVYSGLVESARFYNRAGLPLGQTYLGDAATLMQRTVLPTVQRLGAGQAGGLAVDYGDLGVPALAVLVIGAATLAGLVDAGIQERRRTNRVLSPGLAAAGGLLAIALVWWLAVTVVLEVRLVQAGRHGRAVNALAEAQVAVLQARSNESLVLVARSGTGVTDDGFTTAMARVLGPSPDSAADRSKAGAGRPSAGAGGGLLAVAGDAAGSGDGSEIAGVRADALRWVAAHRKLRALDDQGRYAEAVASAIGTDPVGSGAEFAPLDASLGLALDGQRAAQATAAGSARDALGGLAAGPAVLALLAAAAAAAGIAVRVVEYR